MAHKLLDKEHADITYLKQDEIGLVLSKGLSETYKAKPKNPIDFFAKWLLNHCKTQQKAIQVIINHIRELTNMRINE